MVVGSSQAVGQIQQLDQQQMGFYGGSEMIVLGEVIVKEYFW